MYGKREQHWVHSARRRPGFNVDIFQPGEFRLLHLNQSMPHLDDIRVRRLLGFCTREGQTVEVVVHGPVQANSPGMVVRQAITGLGVSAADDVSRQPR
jgi:hypothetical protein